MKAKVWARTSLPTLAVISSLLWLGSSSAQDLNGGSRQAQSPSIHPPTELTERVSLASTWLASPGTEGNDASGVFWAFISANGRYVAFGSIASNLVDSDTNSTGDVFVRDRNINNTERVSLAWNGVQSNGFSGNSVAITPNGNFVAFQSFSSNLVSLDENGKTDVFVRDRRPGLETTELISVASDESQANADSGYSYVSISDDGRYVIFDSTATNLVGDDTNGVQDVFVRDRLAGTTARVSLSSTGTEGNDFSLSGHISGNGAFAVFSSAATNLTIEGMPGAFLRDLENHTTQFIGIGAANGLTQDGKYIVFESPMDDIVNGDTNGKRDVFIYDKDLDLFELASVSSLGTQANGDSYHSGISADGMYVAFDSYATNLVPGDTNNQPDVFVYNRLTHETSRVSLSSEGEQGNGSSFQGRSVTLSSDGSLIAFTSDAANLVSEDTNGVGDVFVHDSQPGLDVPLLLQTSAPWAGDDYDHATGPHKSIWWLGCNLTSDAMILNYRAIHTPTSFRTDPRELNTWLQGNRGFQKAGVDHCAVQRFAEAHGIQPLFQYGVSGHNDLLLDSLLASGYPAILTVDPHVPNVQHYVVATGKRTVDGQSTYSINDPYMYGRTTLLDHYDNEYTGFLYYQPASGRGCLVASGHSPIQLLVTDPLGRRTGVDPVSGLTYTEIPDSSYYIDRLAPDGVADPGADALDAKILTIWSPVDGDYLIEAIGTGEGPYEVFWTTSNADNFTTGSTVSGTAYLDSVDPYGLTYWSHSLFLPLSMR